MNANSVQKYAVITYAGLLFVVTGSLTLNLLSKCSSFEPFAQTHSKSCVTFADFLKFYAIGKLARENSERMYDFDAQKSSMSDVLQGERIDSPDAPITFSEYTPFFCLAMIPITFIPVQQAFFLSTVVYLSAAAFQLFSLLQLSQASRAQVMLFFAVSLSSFSYYLNIVVGQLALLIVAVAALFYRLFLHKHDILAGICIGISMIKPQYGIVLGMMALAYQRWKMVASAALTGVALLAGTIMTFGFQCLASYPGVIAEIDRTLPHSANAQMVSLRGWVAWAIRDSAIVSVIGGLMGAFSYVVIFIIARIAYKAGPQSFPWAFALIISVSLFLNAHALIYDFTLTLVAWALTVPSTLGSKNRLDQLWLFIFLLYPALDWTFGFAFGFERTIVAHYHRLVLLAMIYIATVRFQDSLRSKTSTEQKN